MFNKECDNSLDPTQNFGCAGVRLQDVVLTSLHWLASDLDDKGASSLMYDQLSTVNVAGTEHRISPGHLHYVYPLFFVTAAALIDSLLRAVQGQVFSDMQELMFCGMLYLSL